MGEWLAEPRRLAFKRGGHRLSSRMSALRQHPGVQSQTDVLLSLPCSAKQTLGWLQH